MGTVNLDPYIFFPGNCKEAMDFYQSIFGGELMISPMPGDEAKVMHADLKGGVISFMASDSDRTEPYPTSSITLSISGTDSEKITELFNKLADGGKITSPLKVESWGDTFGGVTDKFGTDWMVNIGAN
jgi:PhnB protein